MAAVCALRARDRGGPELAQQVLVYPVTDCDLTRPHTARTARGDETFLTTDEMAWFLDHYVADVDRREPTRRSRRFEPPITPGCRRRS